MADNALMRAFGIIGQELPRWWRDINPRTVAQPSLMGGGRANGYVAAPNADITPADVLETGASIPGGLAAMLLGYSGDAEAAKGAGAKGAKGATGAVTKTVNALKKKLGFDFENPGFDRAKMGVQYPDVGPPGKAIDKNTGREFDPKVLTPEAEAVQRAVKAAQKEVDAGNYTPYFDVSQRFYANPQGYQLQGTTLTDALPKKQATIDKYKAEFDTPEARNRLVEAFQKGNADPLARDWYAMGQLEQEFIRHLGEEEGRRAFRERFADAMAATTGGANPTDNLRMAYYGNYLRTHGQSIPAESNQYPYPIGGRYARNNMTMYDKVINKGEGLGAAEQPKRHNFSANFMGYRDRATIDEQMSGGFRPGLAVPPGDSYGVFEGVVARLAKEYGVDPANFQDVTWAGLKGTKGKPMIQHVNEAIERTARVTGKSPEDVVRDSLVYARSPLYGAGAGVGVNEAMQGDRQNR